MTRTGESLLLDSQVWYWLVTGSRGTATPDAWTNVRGTIQRGSAAVSEITFWEFAQKAGLGKMQLEPDPASFLSAARTSSGVGVIQIDRSVLIESALLVKAHRDPADRIIMATAMKYDMTVATADRNIIEYAKRNRNLKVMDVEMWE